MPTKITYVGKRERYTDGLYGTGDWTLGETKPVHDDTARKMLKHADQYQKEALTEQPTKAAEQTPEKVPEGESTAATESTADVVGEPKDEKPDEEEQAAQDARDVVAHMEKDALIDYAQVHFRQKIDSRMSLENARQKVIGLIDQYGVAA